MKMFLEVLTRCYKRPTMLARNQASLAAQTSGNWTQTLIVDDVGIGVPAANARLADQAPRLVGEYIFVLDDDDRLIRQELVAELEEIARQEAPDVIFLKMDHGRRGVLPDGGAWTGPPEEGRIGASGFVIRRGLFQKHADRWRSNRYAADFDFIHAVYHDRPAPRLYWHNVIASRVQRISIGRREGVR